MWFFFFFFLRTTNVVYFLTEVRAMGMLEGKEVFYKV